MNSSDHDPGIDSGTILAGKYRVDRVLGAGGMGVVVAAHHIHLDERVAIKFLLPDMLSNEEAVARFVREARAAVKIKSEHVARVSDVGTLETGAPYMVMEYLEGGDLAGWLTQRGALPVEQAVEFVLQACEALAEAHSLGITHRDLKPANLFVVRRPDGTLAVKVLDFGISKMRVTNSSMPEASMTKTSAVMGSPLYMPPEQLQSSKDADSRADIWALGIILHELLTGTSPFYSDTMPELIAKILSTPPPPLRSFRPDAPAGLEQALLKCLEKDRNRRFESVGELAGALLPFAPKRARISFERISGILRSAGLSASALELPASSDPGAPAVSVQGKVTQAAFGRTGPAPRSPGVPIAIAIALVGVAGVAVGFFMFKSSSPTAPEPASAPEVSAARSEPSVTPAGDAIAPNSLVAPSAPAAASALPAPSVAPSARDTAQAARSPARSVPGRPAAAAPPPKDVTSSPPKPVTRPAVTNDAFDDRK
jgi:eukaryotic-like serine/threonine-protein kinase